MTIENTDRRKFLQQAGMTVGAATVIPLLGAKGAEASGWNPGGPVSGSEPDRLFKAGRFKDADQGYAKILRKDPKNAHANAQRGYIALLSNRFADAEKFLTKAVTVAPGDTFSKERLADCYVRQDQFARAVPLLRDTGQEAYAKQYASISGTPYEVRGAQSTRLPFKALNPLPLVEASVNGAPAARFILDTGAPLAFSMETAEKAGLRAVATSTETLGYQPVTMHHGVVGSIRIGDIEVRNVPVVWHDGEMPHALGSRQRPAGTLGSTLFHHFLATLDFGNQAFTLRRKTSAQLNGFRAEAGRANADRLPLWLADARVPCTLGSLNNDGPKVVSLNTGVEGGAGAAAVFTTEAIAERAGALLDHKRPNLYGTMDDAIPFIVRKTSLGRMSARDLYGYALKKQILDDRVRFQTLANFSMEFFKPFALTFDYTNMDLYISHK
ncbi:retropepsin-like aspartic protease [Actinomadura rubrisoli]|uniref:Twin-arginine translocation signal domain-containing protein n=1 Tax=Actinomadura rubrisoli TaxID=2530368 RepID=A0A4R5B9M7_9ACTN|nr:retropepsin-like aspartic protease [Actinomadura rubrisoli]TDD80062.1 twin-arginine translocation signal domain-containing protein [Actinomadura rubrisoli]